LKDWLTFDWKAGWGTEKFEEYAEEPGDTLVSIKEAISGAKEDPEALQEISELLNELMEVLDEDVVEQNKALVNDAMELAEGLTDIQNLSNENLD
jgi:gas vesicle protein